MRSEIFYFDDQDKRVRKRFATHAIIREYDDSGNFVNEIFVKIGNAKSSDELSEEDLKLIAEFDKKYGPNLKKC